MDVGQTEFQLRFAMVCSSNFNRSMEAHHVLMNANLNVESYGVGRVVKIPGASENQPNVYEFGTPYAEIHKDLIAKDKELYERRNMIKMLERNMKIKRAPQKWQHELVEMFDVAITFEKRVFDQLVDDMQSRTQQTLRPLLVVNMDVKDSHEESLIAAPQALRLCQLLQDGGETWEDQIDAVMDTFEAETGRRPLYQLCFY